MNKISYQNLNVGDKLPSINLPPISRLNLALYCGASGDHNPIHVDIDFAKQAGVIDVFAHGMLSMAWLGRLLTNWVPQEAIRQYRVRFAAITKVGEQITCQGQIVDKFEEDGDQCVRLEIQTINQDGQVKLSGEAVIKLN